MCTQRPGKLSCNFCGMPHGSVGRWHAAIRFGARTHAQRRPLFSGRKLHNVAGFETSLPGPVLATHQRQSTTEGSCMNMSVDSNAYSIAPQPQHGEGWFDDSPLCPAQITTVL